MRSVSCFLVWWSCLLDRLWRVLPGSSGVFHLQQLRISSSTLVILCYEVDVRVELRFTTKIWVIFYSQIVRFSTYFQNLAWLRSLVACFGTPKFSPLSSLQLAMFCAQTLLVQFQYSRWFELEYPPFFWLHGILYCKNCQYMKECHQQCVCKRAYFYLCRGWSIRLLSLLIDSSNSQSVLKMQHTCTSLRIAQKPMEKNSWLGGWLLCALVCVDWKHFSICQTPLFLASCDVDIKRNCTKQFLHLCIILPTSWI